MSSALVAFLAIAAGVFANSGLSSATKANLWPGGVVPYIVTTDTNRVVRWKQTITCSPGCTGGNVCIAGPPNRCGPLPCVGGQVFIDGTCITQGEAVRRAGNAWTMRTEGRIQFRNLTARASTPYVNVDFTFDAASPRCSTGPMTSPLTRGLDPNGGGKMVHSVGRPVAGDPNYPEMGIQPSNCNEPLGLAHELGHVLGLAHHQQRSDRDLYIDQQTVPGYVMPSYGPRAPIGSAEWGDYDLFSAMHYMSNDLLNNADGANCVYGGDVSRCLFLPKPWYRQSNGSVFGPKHPYYPGWWTQPAPLPPDSDVSSLVEMYAMEWGWNTPARPEPGWTSTPGSGGWALRGLTTAAPLAAPAVASFGSRMDAFVRGSDNALWQNTYTGSGWSGWTSRGGIIESDPVAISARNGRVDVVARTGDNHTWHWSMADGVVYGWDEVKDGVSGPAIGVTGAKPAIVAAIADQPEVFIRSSGGLQRYWWNGSFWRWSGTWSVTSNALAGSPGVAATASDHRIDLFSPRTDGHIWNLPLTCDSNGGCSAGTWTDGGGSVSNTSAPAVAARLINGKRRVDVFVRGPNNMLYWSYKSDTTPFSGGFLFLGRKLNTEPTAVWNEVSGVRLDLFFGNTRPADLAYEIIHKWAFATDLSPI